MKTTSIKQGNRGKNLEKLIEFYGQRYLQQGRGFLIRTPPEIRHIRTVRGGQFLACYASKGVPDYVMIANGYSFLFDAKEFKGKSFPLKNLHLHQFEALKIWEGQGGFSFLILNAVDQRKFFVLPLKSFLKPYENWQQRKNLSLPIPRGQGSLKLEKIISEGVEFDEDGFLNPLISAVKNR